VNPPPPIEEPFYPPTANRRTVRNCFVSGCGFSRTVHHRKWSAFRRCRPGLPTLEGKDRS